MTDVKSTGETRIADQVVQGLARELGGAHEKTAQAVLTIAQSHAESREMERTNRSIDHDLWRGVQRDIQDGNRAQQLGNQNLQDTMTRGFDRVVEAVGDRGAAAPSDSVSLPIPKKWLFILLVVWLGGDTGKDLVVQYLTGTQAPVATAPASKATPSKGDGS